MHPEHLWTYPFSTSPYNQLSYDNLDRFARKRPAQGILPPLRGLGESRRCVPGAYAARPKPAVPSGLIGKSNMKNAKCKMTEPNFKINRKHAPATTVFSKMIDLRPAYSILFLTIVILTTGCSRQNERDRLVIRIERKASLSNPEKTFAIRMADYFSQYSMHIQSKEITDRTFHHFITDQIQEVKQNKIFQKWGFDPDPSLGYLEKYYLINTGSIDHVWTIFNTVDLNQLTESETKYLVFLHEQYGSGLIDLRAVARNQQGGTLTTEQNIWFDLIKVCSDDDSLDDRELIFSYRLSPR